METVEPALRALPTAPAAARPAEATERAPAVREPAYMASDWLPLLLATRSPLDGLPLLLGTRRPPDDPEAVRVAAEVPVAVTAMPRPKLP